MHGRLVVAQSGGPSPVLNASLAGVIAEAKRHDCFTGVYGLVHGIEGALNESMIDLSGETDDTLERLAQTPGAALGASRHKIGAADYGRILDVFRAHDIRYFVYLGGNGSMYVCNRLATLDDGLRVMGVPKTIDNDLTYTDHSPGYGSAARFMALATRDAGLDLRSMATFDDVVLFEAMGRNTGWLAAASALLKEADDDAPHLIYVPEIAFDEARFLDDVMRIHHRLGYVFVVVGEGIRDAEGWFVGQRDTSAQDTLGRVVHSFTAGASAYLADLIRSQFDVRVRILRPSTIGRSLSACASEVDRREAWQVGADAVKHLAAGRSQQMVTLERDAAASDYRVHTGAVALADVAGHEKYLSREMMDADGTMITDAFRDYALPLIGLLPPSPARLSGVRVPKRVP